VSASSLFPDLPAGALGEKGSSSSFGATQSLYRKYRPQTFDADDLVGQDTIVRTLKNAIKLDRVAHAYLFTGPRGTGKTTTARLLAKAVNCLDPDPDKRPCNVCAACVAINTGATTDIVEIDAASNRGIDDIRELRERVKFAPTFLKTKFYIVDEAHQITGAAANAFLKTLEEPPPHTKFILATTDPEQLLPTIVSRCQRFDFKRFTRETVVDYLEQIAGQEGVEIDRDALAVIGEHAGGSMRDALGILDQLASYRDNEGRPLDADDVRSLLGVVRNERIVQLAGALADADAGAGLDLINSAFESGDDPRQLNRQLVDLLREVMFRVAAGTPGPDPEVNQLAARFSLDAIARHAARFSEIDYRIRHAALPQLPLEIAFVQATLDAQPTQAFVPVRTASSTRPEPMQSEPVAADLPRIPKDRPVTNDVAPRSTLAETAAAPSTQPDTPRSPDPQTPQVSEVAPISSAAAAGAVTVDLLHDLWPKIRLDIKARDRRIEALLSSCDPLSVDGNAITLVTNYKFHWEKMNEDASRDLVQSVIGRLVNRTVTINTEMRGASSSEPRNGMSSRETQPVGNRVVQNEEPAVPAPAQRTPADETVLEAARNIFDAEELTPRS
jgi:DNA polymerase-3 subunit gamma/tau